MLISPYKKYFFSFIRSLFKWNVRCCHSYRKKYYSGFTGIWYYENLHGDPHESLCVTWRLYFSRCYGYRLPFKYCKLSRKVLQKQNEFWTSTYAAVYLFCYHHFPYFFRLLFGNIRQVSALKNTLKEAGITDTTFIADKGFYTENNINVLEDKDLNTSSR